MRFSFCTTSLNKAQTQDLHRFISCLWHIWESRWWGSLTMVPAGNKAKCLLLVNHTTKTIHHHHHLLLFEYIVKSSYFPWWNSKRYEKLIFCLSIFNLKQDNFQGFLKNPNMRLSFLLHMGLNLFIQWLLSCLI